MKFFNTEGPVNQPDHYKLNPLYRWDYDEIMTLIKQKKYFILHAPRQTGKTSCLLALCDELNEKGDYFAVYANVEAGQVPRNDIKRAMKAIVTELLGNVKSFLRDDFDFFKALEYYEKVEAENGLNAILTYLSELIDKPIVLFIDEIDALVGDTLISVFRQLRAGYTKRPKSFPSAIILCGLRDIKDYRIHLSEKEIITGGSPFNIITRSLRLGNFSKEDVIELYGEHTKETGQIFTEDCFDFVMKNTDGQPWLVNALAYEVAFDMKANRDRSIPLTIESFEMAKETLILSKRTHLDQLIHKLKEERVRNIILPMILGNKTEPNEDDIQYCVDLGLIKDTKEGIKISNLIYKEVIPRELTADTQRTFLKEHIPEWVDTDSSIDVHRLLTLFKEFWNENTSIWASSIAGYQEAAPNLVLQAFLQRVLNGGGYINREYGLGNRRTDIFIRWFYQKEGKKYTQRIVMELKIIGKNQNYEAIKKDALEQTAKYAQTCGVKEAQILIFDRNKSQNWTADEPNEYAEFDGISFEIWKLGTGVW